MGSGQNPDLPSLHRSPQLRQPIGKPLLTREFIMSNHTIAARRPVASRAFSAVGRVVGRRRVAAGVAATGAVLAGGLALAGPASAQSTTVPLAPGQAVCV